MSVEVERVVYSQILVICLEVYLLIAVSLCIDCHYFASILYFVLASNAKYGTKQYTGWLSRFTKRTVVAT